MLYHEDFAGDDIPDMADAGDCADSAFLTRLHHAAGLDVAGKVRKLLRETNPKDISAYSSKERKSAMEVDVAQVFSGMLHRWREDDPGHGLSRIVDARHLEIRLHTASSLRALRRSLRRKPPEDIVRALRESTGEVVHSFGTAAFNSCVQGTRHDVLRALTEHCNAGHASLQTDPRENFLNALVNSNAFLWKLLEVLPYAAKQELGRWARPEELSAIAHNSGYLAELFAGCHADVFIPLQQRLFLVRNGEPAGPRVLAPHFALRRRQGAVALAVRKKPLAGVTIVGRGPVTRTGCAAQLARGATGKSVVEEAYEWRVEIADDLLFPNLEGR